MARRKKKQARAAVRVDPPSDPQARPVEPSPWVARGLVALGALAAFGPSVPHALLDGWDDDRFLAGPLVHEVSWAHFVSIATEPHFQAYHPLHLLSYWLDVPWGASGAAIHAVSLALWILALWAVFEASRALGLGWLGALAATLVVGLHPIQVEAVTWASGRKDVLALGFAALCVLSHARSETPWDGRAWASRGFYLAACLAKTTALPLPLVLVAADVLLLDRGARRALLAQLPALALALGLGVITFAIWSDAEMIRELTVGDRASLVLRTITHHVGTALWPSATSPLYPIQRGGAVDTWSLVAGPLALIVTALVAWRASLPRLGFALIGFVALLGPASNLVPLYFQWQDRYLSLPLWPLAFALGAGADALWSSARTPRSRALPVIATLALAAALGARTAQYASKWSDRITLFGHAASTHPDAFYAWLNLGHARRDAGHLEGAVAAYGRAIDAANLAVAHDARFLATAQLDEAQRELSPSRAAELTVRFHSALADPEQLRALGGEMAELGYRRAVTLALDYSFALHPVPDEQLSRAALVQIQRGNAWLADYYVSRLERPPLLPELVRYMQARGITSR